MANSRTSALFVIIALVLMTSRVALAGPEHPPVCPYIQDCVHPVKPADDGVGSGGAGQRAGASGGELRRESGRTPGPTSGATLP